MSNLKICTRCVMDETVPDIFFDKNGVCNLCTAAIKKINDEVFTGDIGRQKLESHFLSYIFLNHNSCWNTPTRPLVKKRKNRVNE